MLGWPHHDSQLPARRGPAVSAAKTLLRATPGVAFGVGSSAWGTQSGHFVVDNGDSTNQWIDDLLDPVVDIALVIAQDRVHVGEGHLGEKFAVDVAHHRIGGDDVHRQDARDLADLTGQGITDRLNLLGLAFVRFDLAPVPHQYMLDQLQNSPRLGRHGAMDSSMAEPARSGCSGKSPPGPARFGAVRDYDGRVGVTPPSTVAVTAAVCNVTARLAASIEASQDFETHFLYDCLDPASAAGGRVVQGARVNATVPAGGSDSGRRPRRPTMRDVAALSGVSVMTVSRVVNSDLRVAPDRATKVMAAVETLGYRHNVTARNLRLTGQPTATVGLIVDDVANPFFSIMQRAIENTVAKHNSLVLSGSSDGQLDRERALVSAFATRRVDGLIMVPSGEDQRYLQAELHRGLALVLVDRPSSSVVADTVLSANFDGALMAVRHLIDHGHHRIAFLGHNIQRNQSARERLNGYRAALAGAGLGVDPRLVVTELPSRGAAEEATLGLLLGAEPPTALFTCQNLLTIGARRVLSELKAVWRVAQIGFDDIGFGDLIEPGLSVVAQDPQGMGALAAEMLLERVAGAVGVPRTVELPVLLVPRGSGEVDAPR